MVGLPAMDTQVSLDIPKRLLPPHSHTRVRHSTHPVHVGFASSACVPTCFGLLPETPLGKPHHHTPQKEQHLLAHGAASGETSPQSARTSQSWINSDRISCLWAIRPHLAQMTSVYIKHQFARHGSEPQWKIFQPHLRLKMTASLAEVWLKLLRNPSQIAPQTTLKFLTHTNCER